VFSPIVTDFIASSSVSSFIQDDGHFLLGLFYVTIKRAGRKANSNHGALHNVALMSPATRQKNTTNNAVEAKSSPPSPEPQLSELEDRTRDCMVGAIQYGSVMTQTQQSTTAITRIRYSTSIMRLTLITMFKLMLRLVVHGNAQYGYDYDATIN
jgi:hypothetical protein